MNGGREFFVMKHALDDEGRSHLLAILDEVQGFIMLKTTMEGRETGHLTLPFRAGILRFLRDLLVILEERMPLER